MDIVFRRILQSSPREAPPGEIHIRALDSSHDTALAVLALSGRAGFVGGTTPNPTSFVVRDDPTLDDMLALLFLQRKAPDSPAARSFADYAKRARAGLYPSRQGGSVAIPVERSLEAVFEILRHNAAESFSGSAQRGGTLADPECRARFLADWDRLSALILRQIADGVDPHRQPLFDNDSGFDEELAYLEKDHETYRRERDAGETFLVEMKQRGVEKSCPSLPALVLKGRSSYLLVPFSRADPEAPDGKKFHLLCVKDPVHGWIVSTDPTDKYDLKPLADRLQKLEDAATPAGQSPHVWRDGKPHKHTIVFAPETGSRLSDEAVIEAIKEWGRAKPAANRFAAKSSIQNDRLWPKLIPAVVVVIGGILAWKYWPPPPDPTPAAPPEIVKSKSVPDSKYALSRAQESNLTSAAFVKDTNGSNVGRLKLPAVDADVRRLACRLAWLGEQRPAFAVTVKWPDAPPKSVSPEDWTQGADGAWRPRGDAWIVPVVNDQFVSIDAPNRQIDSFTLEHAPIADIHLHIMAVGVSDYSENKTGQPDLKYPAADAEALMDQFCRSGETLFTEIHTYGPHDAAKNRSRALRNGEATSANIKKLLREFRKGVELDPTKSKLAVVIFCGHGTAHTQEEFKYIPSDFNPENENTRVLGGDIDGEVSALQCPKLLIFDCCQSGLLAVRPRGGDTAQAAEYNKSLAEITAQFAATKPARFLLSACQYDKLAFESDQWKHGALTAAILQVLENPAEHGSMGVLTLDHLRTKVADLVEKMTREAGLVQTIVPDFPQSASSNPRDIALAYFGNRSSPR